MVALSGASGEMIGVGDIAVARNNWAMRTAMLVDSVLRADSIAKVKDAVFTLGDNVYTSGTTASLPVLHAHVGRSRETHSQEPAPGAGKPR